MNKIAFVCISLIIVACSSLAMSGSGRSFEDKYLWLEEIEGQKAVDWAKEKNTPTKKELEGDRRFSFFKQMSEQIAMAKDRIPRVNLMGGMIHNHWQDDKSVRGVWRRTTVKEFKYNNPKWETLLDIDKLAKDENENWVYAGSDCLPPKYDLCLLRLSRGGRDAAVYREFKISEKKFVEGGFYLPEAKSQVSWLDENTLVVGTNWGEGSLTKSGYPRIAKVWRRGTPLSSAVKIFEGQEEDVSAGVDVIHTPQGVFALGYRNTSFYESEKFLFDSQLDEHQPLDLPKDSQIIGAYKGLLLLSLRSDANVQGQTFKQGSLLSIELKGQQNGGLGLVRPIFSPDGTRFLESTIVTQDYIVISVLEHVKTKLLKYTLQNDVWTETAVNFPSTGSAWFMGSDPFDTKYLTMYSNFLEPSQLSLLDDKKVIRLKTLPPRFNATGLKVKQEFAISRDGTRIPYFLVGKTRLKLDGKNPTLLYGYGGFESSMTPYYSGVMGKLWLERGGVYVLANIRGGGEYGPAWHQAALKHNRQKAFDDFIAVAEDLVNKKITTPEHLGIQGGSNGGLLVGAVMVQRPELFNAVVCEVPLLDMLRFTKLGAGSSWIGEYGDPEISEDRAALEKYSPYHNLRTDVKYPRAFFVTSTKDDRVHPAHARKMAARMEELNKPFMYYENMEGGHSASANLRQRAYMAALEYIYLARQLGLR